MPFATINLVTENPVSGEWALILVEEGPWPKADDLRNDFLKRIEQRIYDAIDIAIDGHLAKKFPNSNGKKIRIQIDFHQAASQELISLVSEFKDLVNKSGNPYFDAVRQSKYIKDLRIVLKTYESF